MDVLIGEIDPSANTFRSSVESLLVETMLLLSREFDRQARGMPPLKTNDVNTATVTNLRLSIELLRREIFPQLMNAQPPIKLRCAFYNRYRTCFRNSASSTSIF